MKIRNLSLFFIGAWALVYLFTNPTFCMECSDEELALGAYTANIGTDMAMVSFPSPEPVKKWPASVEIYEASNGLLKFYLVRNSCKLEKIGTNHEEVFTAAIDCLFCTNKVLKNYYFSNPSSACMHDLFEELFAAYESKIGETIEFLAHSPVLSLSFDKENYGLSEINSTTTKVIVDAVENYLAAYEKGVNPPFPSFFKPVIENMGAASKSFLLARPKNVDKVAALHELAPHYYLQNYPVNFEFAFSNFAQNS